MMANNNNNVILARPLTTRLLLIDASLQCAQKASVQVRVELAQMALSHRIVRLLAAAHFDQLHEVGGGGAQGKRRVLT